MQHTNQRPATASGTFPIGGDLTVYRLGFGTMRLTGPGIWGPPADKQEALAVLRHALDLGVNLLDTADSYGPEVAESLLAEALYPIRKTWSSRPKGASCVLARISGLKTDAPHICVRPWREVCCVCASIALTSINS